MKSKSFKNSETYKQLSDNQTVLENKKEELKTELETTIKPNALACEDATEEDKKEVQTWSLTP